MKKYNWITYASGASYISGGIATAMEGPAWVALPLILIPYLYSNFADSTKNKKDKEKYKISSGYLTINKLKKLNFYIDNIEEQKEYFNVKLAPLEGYIRFNSFQSAKELFQGKYLYILKREKVHTNLVKLSKEEKLYLSSNLYQMMEEDFRKWEKSKYGHLLHIRILDLISLFNNENYQIAMKPILLKYETTFSVLLNTLDETEKLQSEIPGSMIEKTANILESFLSECNIQINKIDELELLEKQGTLKSLEERIDFEKQFIDKVKTINNN